MAIQADHFVIKNATAVFNVALGDEEVKIFHFGVGEGLENVCKGVQLRITKGLELFLDCGVSNCLEAFGRCKC